MKGFLRVFAIFYAIGTYLTDLRLPRVVSIYLLIVQFPSTTLLFKLSSRFVYEKKKKIVLAAIRIRRWPFFIKWLSRWNNNVYKFTFTVIYISNLLLEFVGKMETTNIFAVALFFSIDSLISFELNLHSFFVPRHRSLPLTCTLCIYQLRLNLHFRRQLY